MKNEGETSLSCQTLNDAVIASAYLNGIINF
jgi:hypothetical protein